MRFGDSMIKIAHVISGLGTGGAERMMSRLISPLRCRGLDSCIVALSGGPIEDELRTQAVELLNLNLSRHDVVHGARALLLARRWLQRQAPSVLLGWMYHGNLAAMMMRPTLGVPVVFSIRQTLYDLNREKWLTQQVIRLGSILSGRVSRILYNSETSRIQHIAIGYAAAKSRVIGNGFDLEVNKPDPAAREWLRSALAVLPSTPLVGLPARMHPMKDHLTFVAAASIIAEAIPEAHFVLIGRGIDARGSPVPEALRAASLTNRFHILGERRDMPRVLAGLDIVCLSSAWGEGFPNVLGEALASGVPCVSTDVGDAKSIVGDCGCVVPAGDHAELAAGVISILQSDRDARATISRRARQRAADLFSIGRCADLYQRELLGVLEECVGMPQRPEQEARQ